MRFFDIRGNVSTFSRTEEFSSTIKASRGAETLYTIYVDVVTLVRKIEVGRPLSRLNPGADEAAALAVRRVAGMESGSTPQHARNSR